MNQKKYLEFAKKTAVYPKIMVLANPTEDQIKRCKAVGVELKDITWVYPLIGLIGEAGELANKLKKVIRDNKFQLTPEKISEIIDEKGDLAWYNIILDSELGLDPDMVLQLNIDKLQARQKKNTVHDTGNRNEGPEIVKEKSKLVTFMDIMKQLEGEQRYPVPHGKLVLELLKTKQFNRFEVNEFIKRLQGEAVIYESRPGRYNRV